jgi:hypothetical protein
MEQTIKKISGWVLLAGGVVIIICSIYSSLNIFTAKTAAPEIFKIGENGGQTSANGIISNPAGLQEQIGEMVGEQLKGLLPQNTLPGILNLISWSIFATFLVFAGAKISGLGIKLLKN